MAALGFTVSRWFVFADGRAGIVYDERGIPSGIDSHLFDDLDAALEIARETDVRLHFVLLDHRWMFEGLRDTVADPVTGALLAVRLPHGRANVLHTSAGRSALFHRVFEPTVARYGRAGSRPDLGEHIFGFELMNEPDFIVEEWEKDVSSHVARPIRFEALARMVGDLSTLVHSHLPAITTIGCARAHHLWAWDDDALGLDLLQIHTYPDTRYPGRDVDPLLATAASLGMSRPVLVGEFPGDPANQRPPGARPLERSMIDVLECAVQGGYAGAWPWSYSGTDGYGQLPVAPLREFATRYPQLVNPRARTVR